MIGVGVTDAPGDLSRILVVAPHTPDRDLVRRLRTAGFSVQEVRSAKRLPAALAQAEASAIVVDTPGAADLPWIARVVASAGATPVVVLTSERHAESDLQIRRAGAAEVLSADQHEALFDVLRHVQPPAAPAPGSAEAPPLPMAAPLAWCATALGGVVLAGWWFGLGGLTHVLPGLPTMKANTALMFVLLGTAVGLAAGRRARRVTLLLAVAAAVIATLTLLEYAAGRSLGIDTLLARDAQAAQPGRPSPYTALAFLLGAATVLAYVRSAPRGWAQALLFSFVVVVLAATIGYAYGSERLRGVSLATGVAVNTIVGLLLLAVAIPALRPDGPPVSWLRTPGMTGVLYRRFLPVALLAPPVLGGIWLAVVGSQNEGAINAMTLLAASMVAVLVAVLSGTMQRLDELAAHQRRAETRLQQSEARWHRISMLSPSGLQELDPSGSCVSVNPRWSEITGLPPRAAWRDGWLDAVEPADRARMTAAVRDLVDGARELHEEHRVRRPDGSTIWVSARGTSIEVPGGHLAGALIASTDITPLKLAYEASAAREALLKGLLDSWPGNAIVYDAHGGAIEMINRPGAHAMGIDVDAAIGRSIYDVLPDEASNETRERDARILQTGEPLIYEAHLGDRAFSATKFLLPEVAGEPMRLAAIGVEITEQLRLQRAFYAAQEDFRHAFTNAPVGIALADTTTRFTKVNPALSTLLGYDEHLLLSTSLTALVHPDDAASLDAELGGLADGTLASVSTELRLLGAEKDPIWVAVRASIIRNDEGAPLHLLMHLLDVSQRRRHEQQLQDMADRDALTGLANRRSFLRDLDHHLREIARYGPAGALLMLDLDQFKLVNDNLGHSAGDKLIVSVATVLRAALRDADTVARLGGDEFAVLLPRADRAEAEAVATRLLDAIRTHASVQSGSRPRRATASLGITLFDAETRTAEEWLADADLAMYDAKEAGRDQWAHFASEHFAEPRMKAHIAWVERIRRALEEDRFCLYAQPIRDLETGTVGRYELLLRLIAENGDIVPPGVFLYIAERYDLIQEIDSWVARQAIALLAADPEIVLAANVSGRSLDDHALLGIVEEGLRQTHVNPERLHFELAETAAIANVQLARQFAERVADIGCRFALDDFGAGFGSFYYLKHLPFDYLKIDGEFVTSCRSSLTDQLIIEAVVGMAKGLGKETVAEYVRDADTEAFLREHGVDYAQGFHVGRPVPIVDLLAAPRE